MKILLGQINTTPRDFKGNCESIKKGIDQAGEKGADLAAFPELCIPGYLTQDMMYSPTFIHNNHYWLREITSYTELHKNLTVVVGYVDKNNGFGKPFRNMAAVIKKGVVVATYAKQLLPYYDVFDEGRYFEPGHEPCVVNINNERWGICICEDIWNDKDQDDYPHHGNPLEIYRQHNVYNIIAINSSPWVRGKDKHRLIMVRQATKIPNRHTNLIYVNQVGGQDELIFDGHSFICQYGDIAHILEGFKEECAVVSIDTRSGSYSFNQIQKNQKIVDKMQSFGNTFDALKLSLRDYVRKTGFTDVVVSSSGGVDSAAVIALACEALGAEHVHAIRQPGPFSSDHSVSDAKKLHENFRCHDYEVNISEFYEPWLNHINSSISVSFAGTAESGTHVAQGKTLCIDRNSYNPVADENIQARMRGQVAMHFSNAWGALLLTTGNKTEIAIGYCTLYGDMSGGFAPLIDLYKTEVYLLCAHINNKAGTDLIPKHILTKEPSAELAPGQKDTDSLLEYEILDLVVEAYIEDYIDTHHDWKVWCDKRNFRANADSQSYDRMIRLIDRMEFKRRQATIGTKISRVAFGIGRRIPIVKSALQT